MKKRVILNRLVRPLPPHPYEGQMCGRIQNELQRVKCVVQNMCL